MDGFSGNARFKVLSRLGRGGMGSVYQVVDQERGARMALKSVGPVSGEELLRFKREFRSLRDIQHRNLITLGELFEEHGEWFYTMELLDGVDLLSYVRRKASAHAVDADDTASEAPVGPAKIEPIGATLRPPSASETDSGDGESSGSDSGSRPRHERPLAAAAIGFDEVRLRLSLAQLGEALAAMHRAGLVHRDIKPSNIIVTPEERLVVFDFGLVTTLEHGRQNTDVGFMGTYHYMSPEQAAARPVDARADWYAVGVILFQAMTGRLPFMGDPSIVLVAKTREEAPDPSEIVRGLPADLVSLCRDLLRRHPDERPSGQEILHRLHVEAGGELHPSTSSSAGRIPFLGRQCEIERIRGAASRLEAGEPAVVVVHGHAGVGKSALVRAYLDDLENEQPGRWLLPGRCGEREQVPYRSVDGVIDQLSSYLARLTDGDVRAMLPRDAALLTKVFPVLRRVEAFDLPPPDRDLAPQEQRTRLFRGLRTLLRSLTRLHTIVITLEDLQWIDADSLALLGEVLRPPDAPPILVIGTLRTEPGQTLAKSGRGTFVDLATDQVEVPRLTDDETAQIAQLMLASRDPEGKVDLAWVVLESRGHPLYVDELTQYAAAGHATGGTVSLDDVIATRVRAAPDECRMVLELLCAEGYVADRGVLERASRLSPAEFDARCNTLSVLRLARLRGDHHRATLAPYHNGIRDAWWAQMDGKTRAAVHGRLARAHEASESPDPVALAAHWAGAGQLESATRYAERAGDRAFEALAFDRAAELYGMALSFGGEPQDPAVHLRKVKLARALANAGHGEKAGDAFLDAASTERSAFEALELRRRAAEQFMITGHTKRGRQTFREVLEALDERYHEGTARALASFLLTQLVVEWRTPRIVMRDASEISPRERMRYMALQSAGVSLAPVESIKAADLIARAHGLAANMGEPGRLAWSMVYAAANAVGSNPKKPRTSYLLLDRAMRLAEQSADPAMIGVVTYGYALLEHLSGRWARSLEYLLEADRIFREECAEPPIEGRMVTALIAPSLWETGRLRRMRAHNSRALQEARERGDLFLEANLCSTSNHFLGCMDDDPGPAIEAAQEAIDRWEKGYTNQYFGYVEGRALAHAYLGKPEIGWELLSGDWGPMRRSLVFAIELMLYRGYRLRGQLALHMAKRFPDTAGPMVRSALKDAKRLGKLYGEQPLATSHMLRAAALHLSGAPAEEVRSWLVLARNLFKQAGMRLLDACCTRMQGVLIEGREGAELVARADAYFDEQGVRNPGRFCEMLLPGAGGAHPWTAPKLPSPRDRRSSRPAPAESVPPSPMLPAEHA